MASSPKVVVHIAAFVVAWAAATALLITAGLHEIPADQAVVKTAAGLQSGTASIRDGAE
jgi:hypothetical protein